MNTSELLTDIIDIIEKDINKNSDEIRAILTHIKTLQNTFELDLDEYNQQQLTEKVKNLSVTISHLITTQTELIEFYSKLSGYVLTCTIHPEGHKGTAIELLEKALKYYADREDYNLCARIKNALDNFKKEPSMMGNIAKNLFKP